MFFRSLEDLNYFKNTISSAIGVELPILIELVPVLTKIFPKDQYPHSKIHEVSPSEAEERTLRLVQGFLSCVALDNRPLVLFVDDLQWSSPAEATLLAGLVGAFRVRGGGVVIGNCLLIVSYRVNEIPEGVYSTLSESLAKLSGRSIDGSPGVSEFQIGPLHLVQLYFSPNHWASTSCANGRVICRR